MTEVFETAGKELGLQAWRVESMKLVENEDGLTGNFFIGDSYVLLNTTNKTHRWHIHFWLGEESTQDETGAAAVFSVQLNQELGGDALIYRHTQGYEGPEFLALFKNGVKYMKGGFDSGFRRTKTNVSDAKRLLHVKGRRAVRANEVPLKWDSFNHGDSFVLDLGNTVYQWNGAECNGFERLKADNLARAIINYEKGGKGILVKIEDGDAIPTEMLKILEGTPSDIHPSIPDDIKGFGGNRAPATLYHVCADSGKLEINKVGNAPFQQDVLDSGDSYILDNGSYGKIFVWKGKGASKEERLGALKNAVKFIEDKNYSPATGIEIMAEGAESVLFKQFFKSWRNKDEAIGFGKQYNAHKVAKVEQVKFDMKSLGNSKLAAKYRMVDDGSGKLTIWRVENGLKPVDRSMYGIFRTGECYVLLYKCIRGPPIVYFWLGRRTTVKQVTSTAFAVVKFADELKQHAVQVRVVQGKEPPHLLSLFGGKPLIVLSGKSNESVEDTVLVQVFCTGVGGRAIQVPTSARSLNSNDAFLLKTKSLCHTWVGKGASSDEVDGAKYVASKLQDDLIPTIVKEGSENLEFWTLLGGKQEYANHPRLQEDLGENPPRLFGISDACGRLVVEEVPGDFTQADLCEDDAMMLDVWDQVFVWIGKGATKQEREMAPKLAKEYIESDPRKRDDRISIVTFTQGNEPITFTGFLPWWDSKFNYAMTA